MIEFWKAGGSETTASMDAARSVEAEGWDGQMFMDSQSLCADPYVRMGVWAVATERIKLSTGVTNPLTRHPAVTAAAIAAVQSVSGGPAALDTLSLGGRPTASRLQWLPHSMPKVPLDVAATGPKVIELSAPIAERV